MEMQNYAHNYTHEGGRFGSVVKAQTTMANATPWVRVRAPVSSKVLGRPALTTQRTKVAVAMCYSSSGCLRSFLPGQWEMETAAATP